MNVLYIPIGVISEVLTIIGVVATISTTMIAVLQNRKTSSSTKPKKDNGKDYELLIKGLEQQTLDEKAIILIYNQSIAKEKKSVSFLDFLESFLYYVRLMDKDGNGELTTKATNIVQPIIDKQKAEKPYSNVNDRERRILLAIENTVNESEKHLIKSLLKDLSIAIEDRQNDLNRAKRTNKWSLPASILGSILTLFFGLYSLYSQRNETETPISKQVNTEITVDGHNSSNDSLIIYNQQSND